MKIILLSSLFPNNLNSINGVFNLSRVQSLQKLGCEVKVIAPIGLTPKFGKLFPVPNILEIYSEFKGNYNIPSKTNFENIDVYHQKWFWLPRRFFWKHELELLHFFCGRKMKNVIKEFNPDIIITSWIHPLGTYSKYLEKYFSGKILSISEGSYLLVNPWRFSGWKDIQQKVNDSNNQLIFVSNNQKKAVEAKLNLKKGIVIHNGFNTDYFWFSSPNVNKRNDKTIKLITIGNLWDIKGHDLLLKALKLLGKQYHLTIIGEGEQKNEYIYFVRKNKLESQVSFITKQPNNKLKSFVEESDIYCQASRSEGFGCSPLEAMGCGLPVVASDVGGLPEIIIDDFNGFLFESENVEDLANKIGFAVDKNWDKKAIADFAKDNFSWEKWAIQILALNDKQL